ncbi:hypothetical protein SLS53_004836 [Cytospora paraplurivora]|uniref:AAA+ ATPase domain-containing protein n=1 Tax=Cytospora paraplurivora TaxID=2898453 RepID=A0AAN9YF55_9PEZI
MQDDETRLFYVETLQQALAKDAQLEIRHDCGHRMASECTTCSKDSRLDENITGNGTEAGSSPHEQVPGDSGSALAEVPIIDSSTESGRDTPTEDTPSEGIPNEDTPGDHTRKPDDNILDRQKVDKNASIQEAAGSAEVGEIKQLDKGVPVATTVETALPEKSEQGPHSPEVDSARLPESKGSSNSRDDSSMPLKRLTKEEKAQRAAVFEKQREERKKAHEEETEDIMDEISYQRSVLRSRRDHKKERQKLQELQKKLERLQKKELDDSDYATTDDEADGDDDEADGDDDEADGDGDEADGDGDEADGDGDEASKKDKNARKGKTPTSDEQNSPATEEDGEKSPKAKDPNAWSLPISPAKQDWEDRKKMTEEENSHIDSVMDMIGLETVKAKMLEIKTLVDTARRQDVNPSKERYNTLLTGNPGSGKTTFANLFAKFLTSLQLVDDNIAITSGSRLAHEGVHEFKNIISYNLEDEKGVVIIDDAHLLRPNLSSTGRKALDYIISEMDRLQGQVIFIFIGYAKELETLLSHNDSLQSLIPFTVRFDDYEDIELLQILQKQLNEKFDGRMKVDKGINGVYMRMVARRIGRGRGAPNFGNAREVENTLMRILFRQATRLEKARRLKEESDDLFLTMEDLVGPPPSTALENSKAWRGLQEMIGLKTVKDSLKSLVHRLQINYDREIAEKPIVECSLNRIFLGNPGTGKTTVAKYYGQIMVDIGLLSDGEVVVKNPSDFIGQYIGESEAITKQILSSTRGKVLIIDEAYALSDKSDATNDHSGNIYKTAIVDTLVANIQGTANEDRCVLLLGYRDRMERMFQHVNPGLSRRFPMSSAFEFDDFSDEELRQILDWRLQEQGFTATDEAKQVAMEVLSRARSHLNFGNAGEIDILLNRAKELQQGRLAGRDDKHDPFLLESQDFDSDFERPKQAETRIKDLFKDLVGANDIVEKLVGYSRVVQNSKALNMDPRSQIPFNYLFRGPPGTGKTTTARRIGQVFYDMGILATNQVYECSATDLIGEHIGQTGPKTQKIFQRALGKVLFIDEAYRLNDEHYGKEALIEMLNILTKEAYKNKLVTVLAGYNDDINGLLKVNSGLSSRFPEVIQFENLKPKQCVELFAQLLEEQKLDTTALKPDRVADKLKDSFGRMAALPDWGNARDIGVLANSVFGRILKDASSSKPTLVVCEADLDAEVDAMIKEREQRAGNSCPVDHLYS